MSVLKKRKFAVLIVVVVAVLATLFGVRKSLNILARDAEAMFFDGVYLEEQRYTQPGINTHIENSAGAALGLSTIMENYAELRDDSSALLSARREFIAARSIKEKFSANEKMHIAFDSLTERAAKLDLNDRDQEALKQYSSTFYGAQTAIANSQYNQRASAFMDEASVLAHLLRPFIFVKSPQIFA